MKLSISNIAWPLTLERQVLNLLNKSNLKYIDIAPSKYFSNLKDVSHHEIESLKNYFSSYNIELAGMQSLLYELKGVNIFNSRNQRLIILAYLESTIKLAESLKVKNLVFGSAQNRNIQVKITEREKEEIALEFFLKLASIAESHNVNICLEAQPKIYNSNYLNTINEVMELIKKISHPSIKLQLDIGSMILNKEEPAKYIPNISTAVAHIHLSEPHLSPLENYSEFQTNCAQLIKNYLDNKIVCIEMLTNRAADPIQSISQSIKLAKELYE